MTSPYESFVLPPLRPASVEVFAALRHQPVDGQNGPEHSTSSTLIGHLQIDQSLASNRLPILAMAGEGLTAPTAINFSLCNVDDQAKDWLAGPRTEVPDRLHILLSSSTSRQEIVRALGSYDPIRSVPLASRVVRTLLDFIQDPDISMRCEVLRALGKVVNSGVPRTAIFPITAVLTGPSVVSMLHDPAPKLRKTVLETLGVMADSRFAAVAISATRVLVAREHQVLLHDQELSIRCCFVNLLSLLSFRSGEVSALAIELLLAPETRLLLDDLDEPVRVAMIEALTRVVIAGRPEQQDLAAEYIMNAGLIRLLKLGGWNAREVVIDALETIQVCCEADLAKNASAMLANELILSEPPKLPDLIDLILNRQQPE